MAVVEEAKAEVMRSPKRFTLLFSQKAYECCGGNIAKQDDGTEVLYTCMVDEKQHGPWEKVYLWKDAIVVGGIDRYDQVISHGQGQGLDNHLFLSNMSF